MAALPPPPGMPSETEPSEQAPEAGTHDEHRTRVPVVLALVLAVVVGVGAWRLVSWAQGGGRCEAGDFESRRFGYCVRTPGGWTAEAAGNDGPPIDRFLVPDGAATITVTAAKLSQGQDLARFEQFVRAFDEQGGGTLGASSSIEVGGVTAVAFDLTIDSPDGITLGREVLFAQDGIAWRVQLADDEAGFDSSVGRLDEMLDTWRFT